MAAKGARHRFSPGPPPVHMPVSASAPKQTLANGCHQCEPLSQSCLVPLATRADANVIWPWRWAIFPMNKPGGESGKPERVPTPRKAARTAVACEASLRRTGQPHYRVNIYDASEYGCKVEFVERPTLHEIVWVKFDQLDALEAHVCWIDDFAVGLEFQRPLHPAVFAMLVKRLSGSGTRSKSQCPLSTQTRHRQPACLQSLQSLDLLTILIV